MEAVVDALCDPKELLVPGYHLPPNVDSTTARLRQDALEHLGDSAAARGGVHVPHDPAGQHPPRLSDRLLDLAVGLTD
jgi:hypothetical protein